MEIVETTDFKVGDVFYSKEIGKIYKNHIVAILDKEETPQILYKWYGKRKQWWHYEIKPIYQFNWFIRDGFFVRDQKELKK